MRIEPANLRKRRHIWAFRQSRPPLEGGLARRLAGRDGPGVVGHGQQLPAVEFELTLVEQPPVEPRQLHVPWREAPLIGQVVNRQERPDRAEARLRPVQFVEIDRDQAGFPVVAVQDVGAKVDQPNRLEHGAVKEDEPLAVVASIGPLDLIKLFAVEIVGLIAQICRDIGVG